MQEKAISERKEEALFEVNECYQKALLQDESSHKNLGIVFQSLGEHNKAKEHFQKSLLIAKEIGDRKREATAHANLGIVFLSLGECRKAKESHEKALEIRIKSGDCKGESTCYENLGVVFFFLGDYDNAVAYHNKALVIRKRSDDRKGEASSYRNLATVLHHRGRCDEARAYHEKSLAIRVAICDRTGEATDYENLGSVFQSLGAYDKAKSYHKKALLIRREINDRKGQASSCEHLGAIYQFIGKYGLAKEHYEKALAISIEIGDRKGEASSNENLGNLFQSICKYSKAKEFLGKVLSIRKETGNRKGEAEVYGKLGTIFQYLGEHGKAKEYHEKVLEITKEIGDRKGEANSYGNLGKVSHYCGKYGKAKEYHEKALTIRKEIGDEKGEAESYENLGIVFCSLDNYFAAENNFESALRIRKGIGDRKAEASTCENLGTVCQSIGRHGIATKYFEKALAIRIEIGDRNGEATDYRNLGTVFQSLDDYEKAEHYHEAALTITIEIGDKVGEAEGYGNLGTTFFSVGDYRKAKEYYHKAIAISKEIGNVEAELRWCELLTRGLILAGNEQEAASYLFTSIYKCEGIRGLMQDYGRYKTLFLEKHLFPYRMLSELLCAAGKPTEALYVEELVRARSLADVMATLYKVEQQISLNPQSWVGIERIIDHERNCTFLYISYINSYIYIWILSRNKPNLFRKLKVSYDCFHDCYIPSLFSGNDSQPDSRESNPFNFRLLEENDDPPFFKLIIDSVADLLDEPEIIIVPHCFWFLVPALRNGRGEYFTEFFRIRIVPSLTTLKLIHDSPEDYHSHTGALIVGDPVDGEVLYKGRRVRPLPLPGARQEAEIIGGLIGVQPLLGKQATKQTVLQRIHSVSLIHFAAQCSFARGEIVLSAQRPTLSRLPREEEYLLTVTDISQVRLRAKLVVLSTCHNLRWSITAEEVFEIARAFLGSGARSVLVTPWAIDDSATKQLMSRFYEHLVRGESASESLHQAMKWIRKNGFPEVDRWAPLVLIGDNVTFDFRK